MSSMSNFAVSVVVARLAGAAGLGEFALAYAGWQLCCALHRALITDPMTMFGDARDPSVKLGIKRGFAAELLLGLSSGLTMATIGVMLIAAGQRGYGFAMLMVAAWLPFLLLQDYWRWIGFMGRRPAKALSNDIIFNAVQGLAFVGLFVFNIRSTGAVISSWGLGGAAGALYGFAQYRVPPARSGGWSLLYERWHLSKWLAGDTVLNSLANQSYTIIGGAILGPVGLGQLRAARTLVSGPSMVLMQAGGSLGLPEAAHAHDSSGWKGLNRVAWVVTAIGLAATGACVVVAAIWGSQLLAFIYGPAFSGLQFEAVLIGVGFMLVAFELGPLLVLKVTRHTRWILNIQIINLFSSVTSMVALSAAFGVIGAASSTVVRCGASAAGCGWFRHKARLSELAGEREDSQLDATGTSTSHSIPAVSEGERSSGDKRPVSRDLEPLSAPGTP